MDRDLLDVHGQAPADFPQTVTLLGWDLRGGEDDSRDAPRGEHALVSHALDEVSETCTRAVWLAEGRIDRDGPAVEVCDAYRAWAHAAGG